MDELEYSFEKHNSCCQAITTFNETIKYFTKLGNRVHCAALDASVMHSVT